jgi:1-aminocyclopropane-1-carboxylate deaminase/D-cysteine desulfhydrase-like pyridoxal-dependent ACC family enzyme
LLTHTQDTAAVDAQGIQPNQCDGGAIVAKHGGAGFAGIVEGLVENFAVAPWLFHSQFGADIRFGKASLEIGHLGRAQEHEQGNEAVHGRYSRQDESMV